MPSNWEKAKLSDKAYEVRDLYEPNPNDNIPYIGLEHIEQQSLRLTGIGQSSFTISSKRSFKRNDILFGSLRPYFRKVVRPKFDGVCSTDITVIRTKQNTDQTFLHYFIATQAFIDYATNISNGTRMPRANWNVLSTSEWLFPPLPTQRKIAAILSAYDDLIENNLRRIKIFEEIARNLYDEWFVRFRFPGYEKVKLVDSQLGMIPEGWGIKIVTEAISINPSTKVLKETEKPYIAMEGLSTNSLLINITEYRTGNNGAKYKNGDTLFARITPCLENGKTGYVQFLPTNNAVGIGSTEFIVLRSKTLSSEYVYFLARSERFRKNAINSMSGASGRQRVRHECFNKYLFSHPDNVTLSEFSKITSPMFCYIRLLANKNKNLRKTRDLLIPKLISGEFDVSALDIKTGDDE